ncbi:F-box domain-containing protein [Hirsutella rhossiliensis]|uniref:F-box domain-containing protein n=1 Tax=Hirsutella rhossiliensis TaxID=111463 RepID=A0A9P8N7H7_9HYPO|nr:F-box domain-containing protein [Hirsutella rhossiliensis]KAH0967972.1 F-box domain-containing protein [Hirsutella rhossiliensis]
MDMEDSASVAAALAARTRTAPILRLPLEVLIRIAAGLTTPELCALRLTCRFVEELLYVTFTREFFTKKQFMMTDFSLQTLVDVSRSRLGLNLRQLHIGLDRFPEGIQRPLADDDRERKFKQRYSDYFTLWNTGAHRTMLAEALRNLANLDEVVLRDFNSAKRSRDGPTAEWTSYGSTTIFNETGVRLSQGATGVWDSGLPLQGCSQVFALLLHALGDAAVYPKGIQVMAHNGSQLRDFAFNVPRFVEPSIAPVLDRLEKLHLSIDLSWRSSLSGWAHGAVVPSRPQSDTRLLRRFLCRTPNLKDLRINEHHDYNPALADFLEWLAAPAPVPDASSAVDDDNPPPVAMSHLENLSLGLMNVAPRTLLHVIRKFAPRLQGLELWKMTLQRPLPPGSDPSDPPRSSFWVDFMNQLKQVPGLDLRHFKAGMLKQTYAHRPKVYFVSFKKRGVTVEYTGPCWKDFFDEVTPLLEVKWPPMVTPENDSSNDQDSEDGSEGSLADEDLADVADGEDDVADGGDA